MNINNKILILLVIVMVISCSKISKITDKITNPTAREVYRREFKDNKNLYAKWDSVHVASQNDSLEISLPYGEKGIYAPNFLSSYSYTFELKHGQELFVEIVKDSAAHRVFIDLFEVQPSGLVKQESSKISESSLKYPANRNGRFRLIIQPEIQAQTAFFAKITKRPQYSFPVAGKGNKDIQSFWGMPRDGGARKHEGIDIFGKKGTPVVAAVDGIVSGAGEQGIGGKQVWLRSGMFGNSLYYAHLDELAATAGQRVKKGDTLGYMGTTGNAKGGKPHLHFGIYTGIGAVDPLPFVYEITQPRKQDYQLRFKSKEVLIRAKSAVLRNRPSSKSARIGELQKNSQIVLLGQTREWLHIQHPEFGKAFISADQVKER